MSGFVAIGLFSLVLARFSLPSVLSESTHSDTILINCGSSSNVSVGNRVFLADNSDSDISILVTSERVFLSTNSTSLSSSTFGSQLYKTARLFKGISHYTFPIKKPGLHWIRLYFFPFFSQQYNLSLAKFSLSSQGFTLFKELQIENGSKVMEYSLNIVSNNLVLTFTPSTNSFAFINALEIMPQPDELLPKAAKTVGLHESQKNLQEQALETTMRVNMGGEVVSPQNDTLWRYWISDDPFLIHNNAKFVSNIALVNYSKGMSNEEIAPRIVYGTATKLILDGGDAAYFNISWQFDVVSGFEYLVRFHFCDIINASLQSPPFSVYINSWFVSTYADITNQKEDVGAPYFLDVIVKMNDNSKLKVSLGRNSPGDIYANPFLNGVEIMKISNFRKSLDVSDTLSTSNSKGKIIVLAGLAAGLFVAVVLVVVLFLFCRRRRRLRLVGHSKTDGNALNGNGAFSCSENVYRFPLLVIQEATDNFSENLVIGVGGFGKVYKGVLRDNMKVAVKRGVSQSNQGLAEFTTEIEMLSQFRHRHLVSLIGYCDDHNEMIIIYEYMENGTLKDHLYGSDVASLSWKQRLQICIGSARGLHYLHTGSTKAIIHRDVKSANILLDENFMAKVADFGLSKTGPDIDKTHVSTAVKGSFGYLDPEYLTMQQLTEKSDVYSFGVVMLEVLCGRPVIDPSLPREKVNLIEWAMKSHKRGELEEVIDPRLTGQTKPEAALKFGELVEKCLAERGVYRPSMGDVLWNLEYVLQLQGPANTPNGNNGDLSSSQVNHVNELETTSILSTTEISSVNFGDLADVSMSKVFAQMVNDELR
ncbi:probable receptor-like protein kinase At2g39360 [Humulus lupulus]|uniref:probable receptor-like protein kinase At2g39360 n=1 Tax=Humulus lupulus TaxID=3486 RepID=UPI002B410214|nr:probable receptor-like protein kinase At2g39360 [Humulus lupulus]XP_062092761.1 probable receptor-like protein kinase At2g39360 [Humulus lupulus]